MTTFEQQGYLSDDLPEMKNTIQQSFGREFAASFEVNALAHRILAEAVIDPADMQRVLSVCLLMRLLEGHQSIHILCTNGLTVASKVTLRSNIEALVLLKYVAVSADNFQHYVVSDQLQRKKWLNVITNDTAGSFSEDLRNGISEQLLVEIDKSISEFGASELKVEQIAKDVGLHQLYQTAYRMLSYDVHVLPRSLEKYWVLDEAEKVVAMNFTPRNDDIPQALVPSMATIINALDCFVSLLGTRPNYELQLAECQKSIDNLGTGPDS
jgi:hypothetical protein